MAKAWARQMAKRRKAEAEERRALLALEPITVPPPLSWSNDFPATTVTTIHTVYTEPVTWAPRDFSALHSESGHPWRTVRHEPVPVLVLPRPVPLPWDPYYFMPTEYSTAEKSLPAETFYGVVQTGLALVCAREYPWIDLARARISEIAWGAHPPDEFDEREDVLDLFPPDQLVFLMVLVEICRLEPDFTGFVEPAIADFVNAWLNHCWSIG
ncbi:hypothetical protein C8F04DRAFT_1112487 [Mycena alexandri]|uniref:Uncharacterized protein n=1 Tax=Mycena alexandri TaxID=1745969 RepID=A0AAD6SMQ0_9AGAR|nr:hypothetical protein C8F04DRAFT_1112487 [Mycena alexandri]